MDMQSDAYDAIYNSQSDIYNFFVDVQSDIMMGNKVSVQDTMEDFYEDIQELK